jgi:maleylpyruvate isomerase
VVIHHVDLDIGYDVADIDQQEAEWLLEWYAFRLRDRDELPKLDLISESGFKINLGSTGESRTVRGSSANLLGWLMNRVDRSAVTGGDDLRLPPF